MSSSAFGPHILRLLRSSRVRLAPTLAAVLVALLLGSWVVLAGMQLSPEQRIQRDVGRAQWRTDVSQIDLRGQRHFADLLAAAATRVTAAGGRGVYTSLNSYDFDIVGAPGFTPFVEAPWTAAPFPDRYHLLHGRWPTRAREVAVTQEALPYVHNGRITVFAGRESFTVVGVADDVYGQLPTELAAPGTWESLSEGTWREFPTISALAYLYFDGADGPQLAAHAAPAFLSSGQSLPELQRLLGSATESGYTLPTTDTPTFVQRFPLVYRLPSIVLPLLAGLVAAGIAASWQRRAASRFAESGLSPAASRRRVLVPLLITTVVACVVGGVVGTAGGWIGRLVVSRFWLEQPLSPFRLPWRELVVTSACTFIGVVAGSGGNLRRERKRPSRANEGSVRPVLARRAAALVAVGVAVVLFRQATGVKDSMYFAAALLVVYLLLVPELTGLLVAIAPRRTGRDKMVTRRLEADGSRGRTALAVLGIALVIPCAYFTILQSEFTTGKDASVADVPRGTVIARSVGGAGPPTESVSRVVTGELGPPNALVYQGVHDDAPVVLDGTQSGTTLVVRQASDAQYIVGRALSRDELRLLSNGGALVRMGEPTGRRRLAQLGGSVLGNGSVPTAAVLLPREWATQASSIMTLATVRAHRVEALGPWQLHAHVPDAGVRHLESVLERSGVDRHAVAYYHPPDTEALPLIFAGSAVLLLLLVCVTCGSLFRSQVRAARSYLEGVIAVGVPVSWARSIVVRQAALLVLTAVVASIPLVALSVGCYVWHNSGTTLDVPWLWVLITSAGCVISAVLMSHVASRRLRAGLTAASS